MTLAGAPQWAPELAGDLAEVVLDPPNRVFDDATVVDVGGRRVELRYLGRGHTNTDIVVGIPQTGVVFAGDLVNASGDPNFSHGYPLDWPETATRLLELVVGPVVPGHGAVVDRDFVQRQLADLQDIARLGREIHAGRMTIEDAKAGSPFTPQGTVGPLERCLAQLGGELESI
jgi:glyoxylase-like metal-dependent hydrolase (beta-lactamase superfamily II)